MSSSTNLLRAITKQQINVHLPAIWLAAAGSAALYTPHRPVSRTTKAEMRVLLLSNSKAKAIGFRHNDHQNKRMQPKLFQKAGEVCYRSNHLAHHPAL